MTSLLRIMRYSCLCNTPRVPFFSCLSQSSTKTELNYYSKNTCEEVNNLGNVVEKTEVNQNPKGSDISSLQAVTTFRDLQRLIRGNPQILQEPHQIFKTMYICCRFWNEGTENKISFQNSDEFKLLCVSLDKHLPHMKTSWLLSVFKYCLQFELVESSLLLRKFIILILEKINKLTVVELMQVCVVASSPLLESIDESRSLSEAARVSLETKVDNFKINDLQSPRDLYAATFYVAHGVIPDIVRRKVMTELFKTRLDFDISMYVYFLTSLKKTRLPDTPKSKITEALKNKLKELTTADKVWKVSALVGHCYEEGILDYDEELCDLMAMVACQCNINIYMSSYIMRNLLQLGHLNVDLLNHVIDRFKQSDLASLSEREVGQLGAILARVYDESSYYTTCFKKGLEDYPMEVDVGFLVHWATNLAALGIQYKDMENVFNGIIKQFDNGKDDFNVHVYWDILLLYDYARIYHSDLARSFPREYLNRCSVRCSSYILAHDFWDLVQEVFGGPNYVLKNCVTDNGLLLSIDNGMIEPFPAYAILLGPDERPIDLSQFINDPEYQEKGFPEPFYNINRIHNHLPQANVLLIQVFSDYMISHFRNVPLMSGKTKFFLKAMESQGFDAFCVDRHKMLRLLDGEKKKYLLSVIGGFILNS